MRNKGIVRDSIKVLMTPFGIVVFAVLALVGQATGIYQIYSPQPYNSYWDALRPALLAIGLAFFQLAIILVVLVFEKTKRKPKQ